MKSEGASNALGADPGFVRTDMVLAIVGREPSSFRRGDAVPRSGDAPETVTDVPFHDLQFGFARAHGSPYHGGATGTHGLLADEYDA